MNEPIILVSHALFRSSVVRRTLCCLGPRPQEEPACRDEREQYRDHDSRSALLVQSPVGCACNPTQRNSEWDRYGGRSFGSIAHWQPVVAM